MWTACQALLGGLPGDEASVEMARLIASLPMRLGGLGLRSAVRTAPAAYWASVADALGVLNRRLPTVAASAVERRSADHPPTRDASAIDEAWWAGELLSREGFLQRPDWEQLRQGARPRQPLTREPGEWDNGWQYYASSAREHHFRGSCVLSCSGSADRAHLRSHSGRNAGAALGGAPSAEEYTIDSAAFRVLLLERLRLPLPLTEAVCEGCGRSLDLLGRHRAACTRSGRIKRRGMPIERTLARVCREAGATVKPNVMLVDLNVGVRAGDGRRVEVLAQGLPCRSGKQLAVDVTLRHALTTDGLPRSRAADIDGVVAEGARRNKEGVYPELVDGRRCDLVVVALETGGRWSEEACNSIEELAFARARGAPPVLRLATALGWQRRWTRMLATSSSVAFAQSLM